MRILIPSNEGIRSLKLKELFWKPISIGMELDTYRKALYILPFIEMKNCQKFIFKCQLEAHLKFSKKIV